MDECVKGLRDFVPTCMILAVGFLQYLSYNSFLRLEGGPCGAWSRLIRLSIIFSGLHHVGEWRTQEVVMC